LNVKKLAETIILIAIVIIAIVFLVFYRPVSLWGDTLYEPVYSGSMEPTIPVGSVVVIKPVDPETLKVGDIICFKFSEQTSITHRIVNVTDEGFITKGDANDVPDQGIVKKENVIGKAIVIIPYLGYLGYFVRTPIGFILLIVIPATLIIIIEIKNVISETKTKQRKKLPPLKHVVGNVRVKTMPQK
jgi:signal peptidase